MFLSAFCPSSMKRSSTFNAVHKKQPKECLTALSAVYLYGQNILLCLVLLIGGNEFVLYVGRNEFIACELHRKACATTSY